MTRKQLKGLVVFFVLYLFVSTFSLFIIGGFGSADMTTSDIKTIVASAAISGLFSSATGGFGLIGKLLKW